MMKYILAVGKWIFRRETLSNALFAVRMAKTVFTVNGKGSLDKNKAILRKLEIAQTTLDKVQAVVSNDETLSDINKINASKDKKNFGPFTATIAKDKHGAGNHGIALGMNANILGQDIQVGHNFSSGEFKIKRGPFELKLN